MMNAVTAEVRTEFGAMVRVYDVTRALFAAVGLAAALAVALPVSREAVQRQIVTRFATGEVSGANYAAGMIEARQAPSAAVVREQRLVAEFIARRYRVADEAIARFVATAYRAGKESSVDPLLILAVIGIESRFNPVAESVLGAKGLMQVMAKFHMEKVVLHGDQDVLLEPEANIRIGAQILREYLRRFGETETALQMYAGALDDANSKYAGKVLAERSRIEQTLIGLRHAA
ncbi:MAG: transglycosylase SLT domain-containing protein [Betaproteobacteria bacterium]|nr:transglycosylase SLT domain-containing protein [Betaproteobacteria bacterium]